jgi:YVTN family beta-propeller protein
MPRQIKKFIAVISFASSIVAGAQTQKPAAVGFHLIDTWKLGGDGSWDYLTMDAPNHTLYIARLNRVMVVDTLAGRLIAEIGSLQHAHGIALDLKGQYGYITDGGANCVLVFERTTHKVVATIPAGKNPDSIVFEPTQQGLFVFNGASKNATVIDAISNKVIATVPLPGKPEFSTTNGAGEVFVNIEEPVNIVRLDARSMQPTATWAVAGCEAPTGMAIRYKASSPLLSVR